MIRPVSNDYYFFFLWLYVNHNKGMGARHHPLPNPEMIRTGESPGRRKKKAAWISQQQQQGEGEGGKEEAGALPAWTNKKKKEEEKVRKWVV